MTLLFLSPSFVSKCHCCQGTLPSVYVGLESRRPLHAVPCEAPHVGLSRLAGNTATPPALQVNLLSVLPEGAHACLPSWKHSGGRLRGPTRKNPEFRGGGQCSLDLRFLA